MHKQPDLLAEVIKALDSRRGDLRAVAAAVGLSYDTVLRIRRRAHDPGYSKVVALHEYLFSLPVTGGEPGAAGAGDGGAMGGHERTVPDPA